MFEGFRVVVVTPAGRRRYLEVLIPQVLRSTLVDEYHLWLNTEDPADQAYIAEQAQRNPRVKLKHSNSGPLGSLANIAGFFKETIETDCIYIRLDDDICFLDDAFFERLLRARMDHRRPLLVSPFILNNAMCSYLLQEHGRMRFEPRLTGACLCKEGWGNPLVAERLHRTFLDDEERGDLSRYRVPDLEYAMARFSINCISWFGSDFSEFDGVVDSEEELHLTMRLALRTRRPNLIAGNVMAVHFAFGTQRDHLDGLDILSRYRAIEARRSGDSQHTAIPPSLIATLKMAMRVPIYRSANEGTLAREAEVEVWRVLHEVVGAGLGVVHDEVLVAILQQMERVVDLMSLLKQLTRLKQQGQWGPDLSLFACEKHISESGRCSDKSTRMRSLESIRAQVESIVHPRQPLIQAWVDIRTGHSMEAVRQLVPMLSCSPWRQGIAILLAEGLIALNRSQQALRLLHQIDEEDAPPDLWILRALAARKLGEHDNVAEYIDNSIVRRNIPFADEYRRVILGELINEMNDRERVGETCPGSMYHLVC